MGVGGVINLSGGVVGVLNTQGRGSGRTTRQLLALPHGGWYFCIAPQYAKITAERVNRTDIVFKTVSELRDYYRFHGYHISGFDVDHYCFESGLAYEPEIALGILQLKSCVKPWPVGENVNIKALIVKDPICPCGIARLDCTYHK